MVHWASRPPGHVCSSQEPGERARYGRSTHAVPQKGGIGAALVCCWVHPIENQCDPSGQLPYRIFGTKQVWDARHRGVPAYGFWRV